ncbi:MAG TPA: hypothetical protein VEI74_10640 [Candidatus Methylomirabilis sp.]|nr:hypothetical protein [Candidatus Methylomirabilis sp.]
MPTKWRFDPVIWLTLASAALYATAFYIESAWVVRPSEVSYWPAIVGCVLMTYLSYRCARDVVWGHLFLLFNVAFSAALLIIALLHSGMI